MFSIDAKTFLADFGDAMTWVPSLGGPTVNALVLFDQGDAGADGGKHISREYSITLETAAWVGLKRGEQVTITHEGGAAIVYKLRTDLAQEEDAVFSTVKLTRLTP